METDPRQSSPVAVGESALEDLRPSSFVPEKTDTTRTHGWTSEVIGCRDLG